MNMYYVATRIRYVLVEATDEADARTVGHTALQGLYTELEGRLGRRVPIDIRTARLATNDELAFMSWLNETSAKEVVNSV